MALVEVKVQVIREKWRNENFAITLCRLADQGQNDGRIPNEFAILGESSPEELKPGLEYRVFGSWEDSKHGRQMKFKSFVIATPASRSGVVNYLQQAPWIGPAFANKLWEKFGPAAVKILRTEPDVAAAAIGSKISVEKCREAAAKLQEWASIEECQLQLMDLLEGRGFPKSTIRQAIKRWGNRATEVLSKCPYRIMAFRGCGFLRADKMFLDLGGDPNHRMRQGLCVAHEIANDTEGHIWMPRARAEKALKMKIAGTEVDPDKAIRWAKMLGAIDTRIDENGQEWVADIRLARAEANVAARILESMAETRSLTITQFATIETTQEEILEHATCTRCRRMLTAKEVAVLEDQPYGPDCIQKTEGGELAERMPLQEWLERHPVYRTHFEQVAAGVLEVKPRLAWPDVDGLEGVSDHQREHLRRATGGVIGILGGAPGTGKTYSLAALVKEIVRMYGLGSVEVCAPTGKAAVRCTESLAKYGISLRARTIHSMLGVVTSNDGDWGFCHNERNPLPSRFLIIDEFSMTDVRLASAVLSARARGMHVLIVGDVNQLPPVGAGAPLRDMIAAGLPYGELTEIRRNAGSIVKACASIRDHQTFETDDYLDLEADDPKNLKLIQCNRAAAPRVLLDTVRTIRDDGLADPVWDVQIIVAVNKKSPMGREALNEKLQEILNPTGMQVKGSPFRVADKIICLKNSWMSLVDAPKTDGNDSGKVLVANGEFGRVLEVHEKKTIVQFENPRRVVVVPRGVQEKTDGAGSDDEGPKTGCDLDLGYAVTCHKMQGSSAPIVIVVLDDYPGATGEFGVCDRAWLFTGISRAEKICLLLGMKSAALSMCRRSFIKRRKTLLAEDLAAGMAAAGKPWQPPPAIENMASLADVEQEEESSEVSTCLW